MDVQKLSKKELRKLKKKVTWWLKACFNLVRYKPQWFIKMKCVYCKLNFTYWLYCQDNKMVTFGINEICCWNCWWNLMVCKMGQFYSCYFKGKSFKKIMLIWNQYYLIGFTFSPTAKVWNRSSRSGRFTVFCFTAGVIIKNSNFGKCSGYQGK